MPMFVAPQISVPIMARYMRFIVFPAAPTNGVNTACRKQSKGAPEIRPCMSNSKTLLRVVASCSHHAAIPACSVVPHGGRTISARNQLVSHCQECSSLTLLTL